jgi:hypothetical protein
MRGYGTIHLSGRTLHKGSGGSVLLDKGAGGSASSYDGLEQYIQMTGRGKHTEPDVMGNVIETNLGRKLAQLKVKPLERKPPRIHLG